MSIYMEVKIYALLCPNTGKPRYVGVTCKKIWERLASHIGSIGKAHTGTPKERWLRRLLKVHKVPRIVLIKRVPENEWEYWERYYIALYKSMGYNLTNGTEGGAGLVLTKQARSKGVKKRLENGNYSPSTETRIKMSKAAKALTGKDRYQSRQIRGYREGEELLFWGAGEAERFLKQKAIEVSKKNISACLRGLRKSAGGYKWERL